MTTKTHPIAHWTVGRYFPDERQMRYLAPLGWGPTWTLDESKARQFPDTPDGIFAADCEASKLKAAGFSGAGPVPTWAAD